MYRRSHIKTDRCGRDMKQADPIPTVWRLKLRRDISAAEVSSEEQGRGLSSTPGSLAQGFSEEKRNPTSDCENKWGFLSGKTGLLESKVSSSRASTWTYSLWAPVQRQQLQRHKGHIGMNWIVRLHSGWGLEGQLCLGSCYCAFVEPSHHTACSLSLQPG